MCCTKERDEIKSFHPSYGFRFIHAALSLHPCAFTFQPSVLYRMIGNLFQIYHLHDHARLHIVCSTHATPLSHVACTVHFQAHHLFNAVHKGKMKFVIPD